MADLGECVVVCGVLCLVRCLMAGVGFLLLCLITFRLFQLLCCDFVRCITGLYVIWVGLVWL